MIKIVLFLLALSFFLAYFYRKMPKISTKELTGKVTSISEGEYWIKQQYSNFRCLYPIFEYEYSIGGVKCKGKTSKFDIKRYKVQELDRWGNKKEDKDYFWRFMSEGDTINILYKVNDVSKSIINEIECQDYQSEVKVYLILSILFTCLFVGSLAI